MKILLVRPPIFKMDRFGKNAANPTAVPLGIGSIASVLEKADFLVKVVDLSFSGWKNAESLFRQEDADVVGITCMTDQRASVFQLIQLIRKIDPQTKIVLGGHHATHMFEQILANFEVDAVVLGEGELTFLELVKAYQNKSGLDSVKGIAYKDKNAKIIKNEGRKYIENLDSLPMVAYHLMDLNMYPSSPRIKGRMRGRDVSKLKFSRIVASRGCPFGCIYCSTSNIWGSKYRIRSAQNVVDELEHLHDSYGIEYVSFADDIFTLRKDWVVKLCKEIMNRKMDMIWDCETRVDNIDYELLCWMKKAGCYLVKYGIESGSSEILKSLKKNITVEQIMKAIEITHKAKIKCLLFLMVGNPGETEKTINDSINLIIKTKPDCVTPFITMVFPGTSLYEMCKSKGYIDDEFWLSDKPTPYYSLLKKEYTFSQLRCWVENLVISSRPFPESLIRKIRRIIHQVFGIRLTRQSIEFWRNDAIKLKIKWRA